MEDWDSLGRIVIGIHPDDDKTVEAVKRTRCGLQAPFVATDVTSFARRAKPPRLECKSVGRNNQKIPFI